MRLPAERQDKHRNYDPLYIEMLFAVPDLENLNNFGWHGSYSIISLQNKVYHRTLGTALSSRFFISLKLLVKKKKKLNRLRHIISDSCTLLGA